MSQDRTNHPPYPVIIVGAGLSGTLMALYLARSGYHVCVFEKRPDPREQNAHGGRSINLAISERGLHALRALDLEASVQKLCLPMYGRMIHDVRGHQTLQPYGQPGQHINSISRRDLNIHLLNAAEQSGAIDVHFEADVVEVDLPQRRIATRDADSQQITWHNGAWIVGADGVNSVVRDAIVALKNPTVSEDVLDYGYKELVLPAGQDGTHLLDAEALHIWPRSAHMLIALPNPDGSFTVTLFLPYRGEHDSFEALDTPAAVRGFFSTHFPDALACMPDLAEQFFRNPIGRMTSVSMQPWNADADAVVIGDASHAIVPFYGQGMNAAFEDCFILDQHLQDVEEWGLDAVLSRFSKTRYPHAEAIRTLSLDNFIEMRASVRNPVFLAQKQIERAMAAIAPHHYMPLYSMISFSNTPYANAVQRAKRQQKTARIVAKIAAGAATVGGLLLTRSSARKR